MQRSGFSMQCEKNHSFDKEGMKAYFYTNKGDAIKYGNNENVIYLTNI